MLDRLRSVSEDWQHEGDELDFSDELEDQWIAEWDHAERDAVEVLRNALRQYRAQPQPGGQLKEAADTVRSRLREGDHPLDWVWQAAAMSNDPAPDDDAELLIRLAAATISPRDRPVSTSRRSRCCCRSSTPTGSARS